MRIAIIAFCALLPSLALANPKFCQTLQLSSPESMGDWTRTKTAEYESLQPGAGYGVQYSGPNASLTAFYYDGRRHSFDIEAQLEVLRQAIGEVQKVIEMSGATVVSVQAKQLELNTFSFLSQSLDSTESAHLVAVGARGDCYIKIRFTSVPGFEDPEGVFTRMLRDYDAILR